MENLALIYCEDQTGRYYILQEKKKKQIVVLILVENAQIVDAEMCSEPVSGLQHDHTVPPHHDLTCNKSSHLVFGTFIQLLLSYQFCPWGSHPY